MTGTAVLLIDDHPVQRQPAQHDDIADHLGGDPRLGAERQLLGEMLHLACDHARIRYGGEAVVDEVGEVADACLLEHPEALVGELGIRIQHRTGLRHNLRAGHAGLHLAFQPLIEKAPLLREIPGESDLERDRQADPRQQAEVDGARAGPRP